MANTTQGHQSGNRTIIIPPGSLNPDQVNVVYIPPSLHNTTHPLLVTSAHGTNRSLRALSLPIWDDELSRRDEGNATNTSARSQNTSIPGDSGYEADISAFGTTRMDSTYGGGSTMGYDADISNLSDNAKYKRICSNSLEPGSINVTHMSSKTVKSSSNSPTEGRSITIDSPQGIGAQTFQKILESNLAEDQRSDQPINTTYAAVPIRQEFNQAYPPAAQRQISENRTICCPPNYESDQDQDYADYSNFDPAFESTMATEIDPSAATANTSKGGASAFGSAAADWSCPEGDCTPSSYYDYTDSHITAWESTDKSLMVTDSECYQGKYNIITPMTPSPTKPSKEPCPQTCSSWQTMGGNCYEGNQGEPVNTTNSPATQRAEAVNATVGAGTKVSPQPANKEPCPQTCPSNERPVNTTFAPTTANRRNENSAGPSSRGAPPTGTNQSYSPATTQRPIGRDQTTGACAPGCEEPNNVNYSNIQPAFQNNIGDVTPASYYDAVQNLFVEPTSPAGRGQPMNITGPAASSRGAPPSDMNQSYPSATSQRPFGRNQMIDACAPGCEDPNVDYSYFQPDFQSTIADVTPASYYDDMYEKASAPPESDQWPLSTDEESSFGPANTFPFEYGPTRLDNKTYHGCPPSCNPQVGQGTYAKPAQGTFVKPAQGTFVKPAGPAGRGQPMNTTGPAASTHRAPPTSMHQTYSPATAQRGIGRNQPIGACAPSCEESNLDYSYFQPDFQSTLFTENEPNAASGSAAAECPCPEGDCTPSSYYDYTDSHITAWESTDKSLMVTDSEYYEGKYNIITPMTPSPTKPGKEPCPQPCASNERPTNVTFAPAPVDRRNGNSAGPSSRGAPPTGTNQSYSAATTQQSIGRNQTTDACAPGCEEPNNVNYSNIQPAFQSNIGDVTPASYYDAVQNLFVEPTSPAGRGQPMNTTGPAASSRGAPPTGMNQSYSPATSQRPFGRNQTIDACAPGCEDPNVDYSNFQPDFQSTLFTENEPNVEWPDGDCTPSSYYDYTDSCITAWDSTDKSWSRIDDDSEYYQGKHNIITPMTPSPTKPGKEPCPQPCASNERPANVTFAPAPADRRNGNSAGPSNRGAPPTATNQSYSPATTQRSIGRNQTTGACAPGCEEPNNVNYSNIQPAFQNNIGDVTPASYYDAVQNLFVETTSPAGRGQPMNTTGPAASTRGTPPTGMNQSYLPATSQRPFGRNQTIDACASGCENSNVDYSNIQPAFQNNIGDVTPGSYYDAVQNLFVEPTSPAGRGQPMNRTGPAASTRGTLPTGMNQSYLPSTSQRPFERNQTIDACASGCENSNVDYSNFQPDFQSTIADVTPASYYDNMYEMTSIPYTDSNPWPLSTSEDSSFGPANRYPGNLKCSNLADSLESSGMNQTGAQRSFDRHQTIADCAPGCGKSNNTWQ